MTTNEIMIYSGPESRNIHSLTVVEVRIKNDLSSEIKVSESHCSSQRGQVNPRLHPCWLLGLLLTPSSMVTTSSRASFHLTERDPLASFLRPTRILGFPGGPDTLPFVKYLHLSPPAKFFYPKKVAQYECSGATTRGHL